MQAEPHPPDAACAPAGSCRSRPGVPGELPSVAHRPHNADGALSPTGRVTKGDTDSESARQPEEWKAIRASVLDDWHYCRTDPFTRDTRMSQLTPVMCDGLKAAHHSDSGQRATHAHAGSRIRDQGDGLGLGLRAQARRQRGPRRMKRMLYWLMRSRAEASEAAGRAIAPATRASGAAGPRRGRRGERRR